METMNGRSRWDRQFHIIGQQNDLADDTPQSHRHDELLKLAVTFATDDLCIFPMHWVNNDYCSCGSSICVSPGMHPIEWDGACLGTGSIPTTCIGGPVTQRLTLVSVLGVTVKAV